MSVVGGQPKKKTRKYNNRVYVRVHKYVLGPTQTHFSPSR